MIKILTNILCWFLLLLLKYLFHFLLFILFTRVSFSFTFKKVYLIFFINMFCSNNSFVNKDLRIFLCIYEKIFPSIISYFSFAYIFFLLYNFFVAIWFVNFLKRICSQVNMILLMHVNPLLLLVAQTKLLRKESS